MPNFYSAKFKNKSVLANGTYELTFATDEPFEYKPGQYIWLILSNLNGDDSKGTRRAFSITSSIGNQNSFSIIFRSGSSPFKQTLLQLTEGAEVKVWGPLGSSFVLDSTIRDHICLIGGGVGSAPFISILRSFEYFPKKPKITFINLNSNENDMFLIQELENLTKKHFLSLLNETGKFEEKYVTEAVDYRNMTFFICGVQGFVNDVYTKLKNIKIADGQMKFEEFYPKNESSSVPEITDRRNDPFDLAVQSSTNHIIITDQNGIIIYANRAASIITGYSNSEIVGQTPRVWGGLMSPDYYKDMWSTLKSGNSFEAEINNIRKNGEKYIAFVRIAPIFGKNKDIIGFVGTEEDITKAKEIDKMKSEFISLASHQLRTPLSEMRWLLEMLLKGDTGTLTDKQMGYIKNIDEGNQQMITLVNQLLDISRIESGSLNIMPTSTQLRDLVVNVIDELKPIAYEKQIKLLYEVDPNLPIINIDPKLISEVYKNLIDNAIKYTSINGQIRVLVGQNKYQIVSQIGDNGIGIPEEEKSKIFGRFFRASNATHFDPNGTGLGLYLVKDIVENSGGKIWFESLQGKGTTFYFSLPITGRGPGN